MRQLDPFLKRILGTFATYGLFFCMAVPARFLVGIFADPFAPDATVAFVVFLLVWFALFFLVVYSWVVRSKRASRG
jgi:hypothetical protein